MYEPLTPLAPQGEPRPQPVEPIAPAMSFAVEPAPAPRRAVGPRFVLSAVLASALLASGGTYLVVSSTDHDATTPAVATGTNASTGNGTGTTAPSTTTGGGTSVVDIVKAVSPAVVTIVAESSMGTGTGSGVIFDANGLILTNHHVVAGDPQKLTVNLKDGRSFDATIYGIDTLTDLAIVKVDATGLPTAPIGDSSTIEVGQEAIAIGSPLGTFTDSVTSGIISAVGRTIPVEDGVLSNLLQTDTAINPGNSGGPLLDPSGKVIGINTAVASQGQNIGFAIPIDIARPLLAQASAGQPLARAWLGIRFESIDPTVKRDNGLTVDNGAWIPAAGADQGGDAVVAGSPAAQAGLVAGDIITAVDGTAIDAAHPFDLVMSQLAPGASVTLNVLRDGQATTITVVLGTRPATT